MVEYPVRDAAHAMMLARANAIGAYASLEGSLCSSFTHLCGVTDPIGGLVFFRMVNTKSRLAVLETLLKSKHPEYTEFRNSILRHLRSLDGVRNQIIHWTLVPTIAPNAAGVLDLDAPCLDAHLQRPDHWWITEDSSRLSVNDVLEFSRKCIYVTSNLNMFNVLLIPDPQEHLSEMIESSREICRGPVPYPPPEGHPISAPPQVWNNPLQS